MPTTSFDNPFLPADMRWVGIVLLLMVGLLLASTVIAVAVRVLDESPTRSDDDAPDESDSH